MYTCSGDEEAMHVSRNLEKEGSRLCGAELVMGEIVVCLSCHNKIPLSR